MMEQANPLVRSKAKAVRLIGIANELLAMAREIEIGGTGLRDAMTPETPPQRFTPPPRTQHLAGKDHPIWVELARQTYEDRRRRAKIFASDELFGEPAWDILLDLFIATKERRRVSVSSACIGAAVPSTTALRWITILEKQGFLLREADPGDARRFYLKLTARGYQAMLEYFASSSRAIVFSDAPVTKAASAR